MLSSTASEASPGCGHLRAKDHTYYAVIRVLKGGEVIEIDSRPSDAIAIAVTCDPNLPIYVSEEVLADVLG